METNRIFRGFCINRFGIGPLHYISSRSNFGFEFSEMTPQLNDTGSRGLSVSTIRGVGDSSTQQYGESPTLRITDTRSRQLLASLIRRVGYWIKKKKLAVSVIWRVLDSAYQWCRESLTPYHWVGESPTPRIIDTENHRLPVLLSRGVDDSAYRWYGESLVEKN
jgi:hypothetical protein